MNKLKKKILKDNIVRQILLWIKPYFHFCIGSYYICIHILLVLYIVIILLFSNNIIHLSVLLIIIITDVYANVIQHNCPLTHLEIKYLKKSFIKELRKKVKILKIHYKANKLYEYQLEFITNLWCFTSIKILCLIIIRTFNIQHINTII